MNSAVGKTVRKAVQQRFDYFLILDFEATCWKDEKRVPQEIIEFPVLKMNSQTLEVESTFHRYVQPQVHVQLSPFCTELTGIIQDMVDGQPVLKEVLQEFDEWMKHEILSSGRSFIFITCGHWDLGTMLPGQCQYFNLPVAPYFNQWVNIKKTFSRHYYQYGDLMVMLKHLKITPEGRWHSGIDDCKNIAKIVRRIVEDGVLITANGFDSRSQPQRR